MIATITVFTLGVGSVAYWRRIRLPADYRLSLTIHVERRDWKEYTSLEKGLAVALVASVLVAAGTFIDVVSTPSSGERFTEFYILGPGGDASNYPTNLTANEIGGVIIGVVNHEAATVNYRILVDLVGVRIAYNTTAGLNETVDVNRTTWSIFNFTLANDQNWTQSYNFRINNTGLWKVQFLLFSGGNFLAAYRQVYILVHVT